MAAFAPTNPFAKLPPKKKGPLPGLGAPGWEQDPRNPNSPNNPEFQAKFKQAADAGFFGPPSWLQSIDARMSEYDANNNNTAAYDQAYQQAMATARANITQQIGNALNEISTRQGATHQALGLLPGQIGANYDAARASVQQGSQAAAAAQQAAGVTSFLPQGAEMQPGLAAIDASNAGAQAGVPVFGISLDNAFSKQRQDVQSQGDSRLADLELSAAERQASQAQQSAEARASYRQQLIDQHFAQQDKQAQSQQKTAAARRKAVQKTMAGMPAGISAKGGDIFVKNLPEDAAAVKSGQAGRASEAYQMAYSLVSTAMEADPEGKDESIKATKDQLRKLMKKYPKQAAAISLALHDLGANNLSVSPGR